MSNEPNEERPESLEDAAARLLAGLERRAKKREAEGQKAVTKALSLPSVDPEERQDAEERVVTLRVMGLMMRHAKTWGVTRFAPHANRNVPGKLPPIPLGDDEEIPW